MLSLIDKVCAVASGSALLSGMTFFSFIGIKESGPKTETSVYEFKKDGRRGDVVYVDNHWSLMGPDHYRIQWDDGQGTSHIRCGSVGTDDGKVILLEGSQGYRILEE